MKTKFGMLALGIGFTSLVLCVGCEEDQSALANAPVLANAGPSFTDAAAEAEPQPAAPLAQPAETPPPVVKNEAPPAPPGSIIITKTSITNAAAPAPPSAEPPQLSPALVEVVRLIQANVSQDILLAYITNAAQPFYVGASEIVYLRDLGAPLAIVTTLINVDSTPEMQARKQAAVAVKPLPAGVALTTPTAQPRATATPVRNPPEPLPVNQPAENGAAYTAPPPEGSQVVYEYPPPATEVSYSYFYNSLSPYGSWVDVPGYGSCWRPTCATWNSSWRPYADNGRWLWSDSGWYWYSDYSWGWAPFHYGRWCQPSGFGWVWRPDTVWGPSWVSWRYSQNYCGWAPLPPTANYVSGLGFYFNSGSVGIGFEFGLSAGDYCYVPSSRFGDRRPFDHFLPHHQNHVVHKDTTVINNYVVGNNNTIINNGPGLDRVAKVTRGDIKRVALRDTTSVKSLGTRHERLEGDGQTLTVYRPPSATLAHKSVVMASTRPASATHRPATYVKPAAFASQSTPGSVATVTPSASAAVKSYTLPGTATSRTAPTPVTLYPKPVNTANQPVIVTGGTAPQVPSYTKPESSRLKGSGYSAEETPLSEPARINKPALTAGGGRHQTVSSSGNGDVAPSPGSAYVKPGAGIRPYSSLPGTPLPLSPAKGSVSVSSGSPKGGGIVRSETSRGGYTQPITPRAPVASSPQLGNSRPVAAAPSHSSGRVSSTPAYSAPARMESHQSRVSAPSGGGSSGGRSGGSSGGGQSKSSGSSSSSSSDNKKGR